MTVANAAKFAATLRTSGQRELAVEVAASAAKREPGSSVAHYQHARALHSLGRPGATRALDAAFAGDLSDVALTTITAFALRTMDQESWDHILEALPDADAPHVRDYDRAGSVLLVAAARAVREGTAPTISASDPGISDDLLELVIVWLAEDSRWNELDRFVADVGGDAAIADKFPLALASLVRALKKRGELERLVVLSGAEIRQGPSHQSLYIGAVANEALQLARAGWPAPVKAAAAQGAPGRVGYLVHHSLPYGSSGYATRTQGLLTGLATRGWRPTAVTRPPYPLGSPASLAFRDDGKPLQQEVDGISYRRILTAPYGERLGEATAHFAEHVAQIAREERWGVVHGASNHTVGLAAVEAAARLGLPSVYEVRGLWEMTRLSREPAYGETSHFELYARMEADACRLADHAFAITGAVRDILVERGVPRDHISLLPNGVDTTRFHPLVPNAQLRKSLGLEGKVVIGYVGSISDYEGLPLLAEAARDLDAQGLPVALLLVGDGQGVPELKDAIKDFGVEHLALMPGRVPHEKVEDYYSIIDIAPFPRLPLPVTEAVSPLKPFEAMAMAKPVVVSSVAALTEIVTEGVNGKVFTKGDASSLAAVLAELVGDASAREELGRSARAWVEENRSWSTVSTRIDEVYERLGVPAPR